MKNRIKDMDNPIFINSVSSMNYLFLQAAKDITDGKCVHSFDLRVMEELQMFLFNLSTHHIPEEVKKCIYVEILEGSYFDLGEPFKRGILLAIRHIMGEKDENLSDWYFHLIDQANEMRLTTLVTCNSCNQEFDEKEIIIDGDEEMDFCPKCGEGSFEFPEKK